MTQLINRIVADVSHIFHDDNFTSFTFGSFLGFITFTGTEAYILNTIARVVFACSIAFVSGFIGVIGKDIGERFTKKQKDKKPTKTNGQTKKTL